jgi:hypothetical protein
MRYTKPTILNDSKATPLIMGTQQKKADFVEPNSLILRTDASAYEADE